MQSELKAQLERNLPTYRETLRKNGWVCLKNVFSKEEVEEFRRKAYLSIGEKFTNTDLLSNPHLRDVLMDDRFLMAARHLLNDKPIYFGESRVKIDGFNARVAGGIHKDNPDRSNPNGQDWKGEYRILRFAIYCQDHLRHSEGLTVRNGSHKFMSLSKGKLEHVPSEPGDIVAFYFTVTHCANSKRIRGFPNINYVHNYNHKFRLKLMKYMPSRLIVRRDKLRIVMFATFAAKSDHLNRYLDYCKYRDFAVKNWQNLKYLDDTEAFTKDRDVEIMDIGNILDDVDLNKVGGHVESPYYRK